MIESNSQSGFVKMTRGADAMEVIKTNPIAFTLAAVIAFRANWRGGFNAHGLGQGEAFLGDYKAYGMTRQQYRTACSQLESFGFATFKTTNKGTIGKLSDSRLFDTSTVDTNQQDNQRLTIKQPTANQRVTTNEEYKKDKNIRKEAAPSAPVPESLNTPEFEKAWGDWLRYRREARKPLTVSTQGKQLADLSAMGPAVAVQSIEQSIRNGWQGLFPPKQAQRQSTQPQVGLFPTTGEIDPNS